MPFSNKTLCYIHSKLILEDLLERTVEEFPDTVAFQLWQDQGVTQGISFKSLLQTVKREGEELKKIGVESGMRIALIEENSIEWVIAFFAILHCKAVAVLIDPHLAQEDYVNLLSLSDPQLLIVGEKYRSKIEASTSLPLLTIENQKIQSPLQPLEIKPALDRDSSLAVFIFTSGTTGNFKAVMLDHQALLYATQGALDSLNQGLGRHVLAILPLTHVYGLIANLIAPLANGMTVTFLDKLQGELILKAMDVTQTHTFPTVPRVINLFAMRIGQEIDKKSAKMSRLLRSLINLGYDLRTKIGFNIGRFLFYSIHKKFGGHLKVLVSGGSSSDKDLVHFMQGLGFVILEGYGLSETTGIVCCQNFCDRPKAGSVGKPSPWMDVQILKSDPDQKEGEILIKGPSVMRGYFRDSAQTELVLKNGWFHTGDLGYLDAEGELYITGRIKEIIVTASGQKAMPLDVERRYQNIPGIEELAVFGMSTPLSHGEDIHAAIVVQKESLKHLISEKERYSFILEKISKRSETVPLHLRIVHVHLVESIPKTATLKIKRIELARVFAISTQSLSPLVSEPLASSLEKNVAATISLNEKKFAEVEAQIIEITKALAFLNTHNVTQEITGDTNFQLDLAFDSLMSFDLIFEVEKQFKMSLKDLPMDQIHTIHALAEFVEKNREGFASVQSKKNQGDLHQIFLARAREISSWPLPKQTQIKKAMAATVEALFRSYFTVKSTGNGFLPTEPYVLCANHCSHLDAMSLILATGSSIDSFAALAAKDYFFEGPQHRLWIASLFNILPFSRDSHPYAMVDNLILCKHALEQKKNLILFPEGTRSLNGKLNPFKSFLGVLGGELKCPLVPAFIHGTFDLLPKGKSFPKPGKIEVAFGPPILAAGYEKNVHMRDTELYQKMTQEIYHKIIELSKKFQGKDHE